MEAGNNRLKIWLIIALAVAGLMVAGWFGRGAYQKYQQKHRLAQAQSFLAKGDLRNAVLCARQVLQADADNAQACQVLATVADIFHSPTALDWWQKVVTLQPTVENKLSLAAAGLRYQRAPFPLTAQILNQLSADTNRVAFQLTAVELACSLNQLESARQHMAVACRLEPTNQTFQLSLASLQLSSPDSTIARDARARLEKFISDTNLGPMALRSLAVDRLAQNDLAAAQKYLNQLLSNPKAALDDRLQYLLVLKKQQSAGFTDQLAKLQSAQTNPITIAAVANWMKANGLVAGATIWLKGLPDNLASPMPVQLALADGYLMQQDWRAVREMTTHGNWGEMEYLRLAFLSHAWAQLGEGTAGNSYWRQAVAAAGKRLSALNSLLGLTQQWDLQPEQENLLWLVVGSFPSEIWAARILETHYTQAGDTMNLRRLYESESRFYPKDLKLKNNLALVSLLLKTNVPMAYQWAEAVYRQEPDDATLATTYAYALGVQGRVTEGLAVLDKLKPEALSRPSVALYQAVLFSMAGKPAAAEAASKIAQTGKDFLPEERELLTFAETQGNQEADHHPVNQ